VKARPKSSELLRSGTGWSHILLLTILLVLSGCWPIAERVHETPFPSQFATGPVLPPPTDSATRNPTSLPATPTPSAGSLSRSLISNTPTTSTEAAIAEDTALAKVDERQGPVRITIVYDNNPYDPRLKTKWGFACLVQTGETTLLFDTGGDGATLLNNMATLGIEPESIEAIVLSHFHGDHTGGVNSLLASGVRPMVYVPRSFPASFKSQVQAITDLTGIEQGMQIADGVYTTGEMGSGIIEQALVVNTSKGLVVVTGCAHPGVAEMVCKAKEIGGDEVYLVLGGFHLGGASEERIKAIIRDFQQTGVQKVAPCHCTGDKAISLFREAYGEDFIQNGVGQVMEIVP